MRLTSILLLLAFFSLVAFGFSRVDEGLSGDDADQDWKRQAFDLLFNLRHEIIPQTQILKRFHAIEAGFQQSWPVFPPMAKMSLWRSWFADIDAVLVYPDASGKKFRNFAIWGNFHGPTLAKFIATVTRLERSPQDSPESREAIRRVMGGYVLPSNALHQGKSQVHRFNLGSSSRGFYWNSVTLPGLLKDAYFIVRFSLEGFNQAGIFRAVLETWKHDEGWNLGFFNSAGDLLDGTDLIKRQENWAPLGQAVVHLRNYPQDYFPFPFGTHGALIGPPLQDLEVRPVVIRLTDDPQPKEVGPGLRMLWSRFGLLFFVVALVLLLLVKFSRLGPWGSSLFSRSVVPLQVGHVLVAALLGSTLVPMLAARRLFSLAIDETTQRERLSVEKSLHQNLVAIDEATRLLQARVFQRARRVMTGSTTVALLREEERRGSATGAIIEPDLIRETMLYKLGMKIMAPFNEGLPPRELNMPGNPLDGFLVTSPAGFSRFFFKREMVLLTEKYSGPPNSNIQLPRKAQAGFKAKLPDWPEPPKQETGRIDRDALIQEEVGEKISKIMGSDAYLSFHMFPERVCSFLSLAGRFCWTSFLASSAGKARYAVTAFWEEFTVGPPILLKMFLRLAEKSLVGEGESVRPVIHAAGFNRAYRSWLPAYSPINHGLKNHLLESDLTGELLRATHHEGSSTWLMEAFPMHNLSLYCVGGMTRTDHLDAADANRRLNMDRLFVLLLFLAVGLALILTRIFLSPLYRLLRSFAGIERGDYGLRLPEDRRDEFGSLAFAFNAMVRGLLEGRLLGKYVSPAVRRVVSEPGLFARARAGETKEMTILFIGLRGFGEFQATRTTVDLQNLLECLLEAAGDACTASGGEIDKVIGEKILLLFDHSGLGGEESAAVAAVSAIMAIRRAMRRSRFSLEVVAGLTSGQVVSGILGAPTFRLDMTVIGDPVNLAARLVEIAGTLEADIVISGRIRAALGPGALTRPLPVNRVRGKTQEIEVFALDGGEG